MQTFHDSDYYWVRSQGGELAGMRQGWNASQPGATLLTPKRARANSQPRALPLQMPGAYNSSERMARASMLRLPGRTFPWPQRGDIDGPFVPDLSPGALLGCCSNERSLHCAPCRRTTCWATPTLRCACPLLLQGSRSLGSRTPTAL